MYIEDPFDKMKPPIRTETVEFNEPRDYHEFFHDDLMPFRGQYAGKPERAHTRLCRFDEHGDHTSMSDDCPHFAASDQEGLTVQKGWTCQ